MRHSSITGLEADFRRTGGGGQFSFRKISVPVPGEPLNLNGLFAAPLNRSGYYHDVAHAKQRIVLHFTAGNTRSDMATMTRQDFHVSVPFVIARDGTIYQLFSSRFWSGHIGRTPLNMANREDKATIGIEISNYGYLTQRGSDLETIYSRTRDPRTGRLSPPDVYCSLTDIGAYQKLETPFRQQLFYATYTPEQYDSLIILLRYLTAQFNIPRSFLPETRRYLTSPDVLSFRGIVSHINYRESGKWDIGPAFDWKQVIAGVQAPVYTPAFTPRSAGVAERGVAETVLVSEAELEPLTPAALDAALEDEPYELEPSESPAARAAVPLKPNLFALLVGINKYPQSVVLERKVSFPPLRGCVSDAEKMLDYIEQENEFDVHTLLLTDEAATKEQVVAAFRDHLGQAGAGDTVLFYFSGHGTQEYADKTLWHADTDGKLEALACYYDAAAANNFLLADKEVRYLIAGLAEKKPHVVTIFDCCHSGDNTRNAGFVTASYQQAVEKRIPHVFSQRSYNDFIFAGEIGAQQIRVDGEHKALPEGAHIQLAACASDESAMEVNAEGVFTAALLKVLTAAGGHASYRDLQSRVRQYLRNAFEQKPGIYISNGADALLYTPFLNKATIADTSFAEATWNAIAGWQINLGAIHGISVGTKLELINAEGSWQPARVQTTHIDHATIGIDTEPDRAKAYRVKVEGVMLSPVKVHFADSDSPLPMQQALLDAVVDRAGAYVQLADEEAAADYVVHNHHGQVFIGLPNVPWRPLAQPVLTEQADAAAVIGRQLQHMSKWTFLRKLANTGADKLPDGLVRVDLVQVSKSGQENLLPIANGISIINLELDGGAWRSALRIRLTNTSPHKLYVTALYLNSTFGASAQGLNPPVYLLDAGASVELNRDGDPVLPVMLNEVYDWYNWAFWQDHLKVLYCTDAFDVAALMLDSLPQPATPNTRSMARPKGIAWDSSQELNLQGWNATVVTLQFENPTFNSISESGLARFIDHEQLADFALGIYFEAVVKGMRVKYRLRPEIVVDLEREEMQARGFVGEKVIDLANWWARRRRNRRYREMLARFPERPRIVSEGDSWFQHPLVADVIDHIGRIYPVYCVAAAADTLKNYLSGEKRRGEYYLTAIAEQQPDFFLISGGGNDILGEQFRNYLLPYNDDNKPEGTEPKRFLKETFFTELTALKEVYKVIFNDLGQQQPRLRILVHGYDYPIKLDDPNKGWLGRYMIEKGIRAGDRRAVIRLIMDAFNTMLQELADRFPNVSYIDARGLVRFDPASKVDQWYDEIHPNDEGFQTVALRFVQRVQALGLATKGIAPPPGYTTGTARGGAWPAGPLDTSDTRSAVMPVAASDTTAVDDGLPQSNGQRALAVQGRSFPGEEVGYELPAEMEVGISYRSSVFIDQRDIALAMVTVAPDLAAINAVSLRMIDPSDGGCFAITALTPERQVVPDGETASWSFNVRPQRKGTNRLALRLYLHAGSDTRSLDLVVKEIVVKAGPETSPIAERTGRRILFLAANPYDTTRLRLGAESRQIQDALNSVSERRITLTMNMAVTPPSLVRHILKEKPDIVHFSGHGDQNGLCMETPGGGTLLVDAVTLGLLFSQFDQVVNCVVLNACYSEEQAKAIAAHIPYVIGIKHAVADEVALAFSAHFYMTLCEGASIPKAFRLTRTIMEMENRNFEPLFWVDGQLKFPETV